MPRPDSNQPIRSRAAAAWSVAAVLAAGATAAVVIASRLGFEAAPLPFVWTDVALIALLSSLPLAAIIAGSCSSQVTRAALAAAGGLLCALLLSPAATPIAQASPPGGHIIRALAAAAAALALVAAATMFCWKTRPPAPGSWSFPSLALAIAVSLGLPWLYVTARCRHDLTRLQSLMEQSRVGETAALAERLVILAPHETVRGFPLVRVAEQSRQIADEMSARLSAPLPPSATSDVNLQRASDLAMLGRTAEALVLLEASPDAANSTAGCHLRGLIHDARNEFALALEAYSAARDLALAQPRSDNNTALIIDASRGMAFCQRKLGRYTDAEQSYLEMLAFAPTADTHFLLAQFYEDTQQAGLAEDHARQAIALDPKRYTKSGQQLTDKLITHHFGCWGVFASQPRR